METDRPRNPEDAAPDRDDRVEDFFMRHGGPGGAPRSGEMQGGLNGWSEIGAADGYTLRCDWSKFGSKREMTYLEIAPDLSR